MKAISIFALFLFTAASVQADIYKLVDENGHVTYSNVPMAGAKKIVMEPIQTVPPTKVKEVATVQPTPSNFPKVDGVTQRNRDASRKKILEDELKAEEKLLADAKQALTEGEAERVAQAPVPAPIPEINFSPLLKQPDTSGCFVF
jgi:Domain of unknown function (DUF4124)